MFNGWKPFFIGAGDGVGAGAGKKKLLGACKKMDQLRNTAAVPILTKKHWITFLKKIGYFVKTAVLWIQNDLFRIQIQYWIFIVPDPDPGHCYGHEKSTGTPIFILVILCVNPPRMFSKKCTKCFREIYGNQSSCNLHTILFKYLYRYPTKMAWLVPTL